MAPFELYGNKVTFNIESVLLKNIESSVSKRCLGAVHSKKRSE